MKLPAPLLYWALLATEAACVQLTPSLVEADILQSNLNKTLVDLNQIAIDNGGNRAYGLPGYKASLDYVLNTIQGEYGQYFDTFVQPFNHTFGQTRNISLRGPDGEDVFVATLLYNHATPTPNGVTAELVAIPNDDTRGAGCHDDQWTGIDVTGKIVLVKRGVCSVSDKLKLAKNHGASAAVLIHGQPGDTIPGATLSAENLGLLVPVGVIRLAQGTAWQERLANNETLQVTLLVDAINEQRESWNIISETKTGDANNVVMLGAHLDSVQAGAGVNDDGSGTAGLLEIAKSISKYDGYANKVRFAWWGAEESGLIGSLYYGQNLASSEADKIRFYFNYDMIGSPSPIYAVQATTDGDKVGGDVLFNWLESQGAPAEYRAFGTSSDYVAFIELGIPSSGIFTGANATTDPCYHRACDDINNINWPAITLNTKAAGRAAAQFALSLEGVPARSTTTANPTSKRGMARRFEQWETIRQVAEKEHSCAASGKIVV